MQIVDIFQYRDYREFLRDWYQGAKEAGQDVSFRTFSKRAGFKSTNILKLVMDGDRNLTETSMRQFIIGLELNKQEAEYFANLVFFNQAKTHTEKDFYYQRLLQEPRFRKFRRLDRHQYEYYAQWYHTVVRELVTSQNFDGTPEWLAARIAPSISVSQARQSMLLLEKLELIQLNETGRWQQTSKTVSTGPEVSSVLLMNYHLNMLELTKQRLLELPSDKRDISGLTLGLPKSELRRLKQIIADFRSQLLEMASRCEAPEEVIQLNIQMFPTTGTAGCEEESDAL